MCKKFWLGTGTESRKHGRHKHIAVP